MHGSLGIWLFDFREGIDEARSQVLWRVLPKVLISAVFCLLFGHLAILTLGPVILPRDKEVLSGAALVLFGAIGVGSGLMTGLFGWVGAAHAWRLIAPRKFKKAS